MPSAERICAGSHRATPATSSGGKQGQRDYLGEIFRRLGPRKTSTYQKIRETIIVGITVHKFSKFLDAYPNENGTSEPSEVCLPPLITSLGDNVSEMEHCHRTAVSHC